MAQVNLKVTQPDDPTVASLHIFESANPTGPFVEVATVAVANGQVIEEVDVDATLETDWFAFQWADATPAWLTPLSPPVKAGEFSFVELVIDRVRQRDRTLDGDIVRQEAEAAIEWYFSKNPYGVSLADIADGSQYRTLNGLTYLVMARAIVARYIKLTQTESATLGLVSFKSGAVQSAKDIDKLMELANSMLGIGGSVVIDMERICKVYGGRDWRLIEQYLNADQEFAFIPWVPRWVER